MTLCVVRDGARMIHFRVFKRLVSGHRKYLYLHLVSNGAWGSVVVKALRC